MSERSTGTSGLLAKAGLLVASILVSLALAEFTAARAGFGKPYRDISAGNFRRYAVPISGSDYLTFTTPPGYLSDLAAAYGFNALGYRGRYPEQKEKPFGTRRILMLGDSFTVGWRMGAARTFSSRLARMLDSHAADIEVINAGYHAGYSPDAYYAYLVREGIELEPDAVVMNLYLDNDISDMDTNIWREVDSYGGPISLYTTRHYGDYLGTMHNAETLWYYRVPVVRESHFFMGLADRLTPARSPNVASELRFRRVVEAMANWCRGEDRSIDLYFVVFNVPAVETPPEQLARHRDIAKSAVPPARFLDLTGEIFDEAHTIPGDGHFNEAGHQLYAEHLFDLIQPSLEGWQRR